MTRPKAAKGPKTVHPPEVRMLNYDRAAAYLGISRRSMEYLVAEGVFVKVPINGRVLFDKADLDAHIERAKASA